MLEGIYREIIEDSPVAFLRIKAGKVNNIYDNVQILDMNRAYMNLNNLYNIDILNLLGIKDDKNNALEKAVLNKKYIYSKYLQKYKIGLTIEIINSGNEEFFLQINEVAEESIKLSAITRKSPYLAWIKDVDGKYLDINNKFIDTINKDRSDIIGKSDYEIWPNQSSKLFKNQDQIAIDEDEQQTYEELVLLPDNREVYYQTVKWPYKDNNDNLLGVIGIAIEINDRVELRKNIETNEKFFQEISNNLDDVIIIRDKEKAHFISNSFERVFGFNPEDLYEDINIWHEDWDDIDLIDGTDNYESKEAVNNTVRIRKDKYDKWLFSRFVPILDGNGNVIKKIGIISDITGSKQLEEKLQSLRMDFIANLSHEIRTPVTLILSSIQVINSRINQLQENDKMYLNKYTSIMIQNSYRLLKLINNLIDTKRIDSGKFNYRPQNRDIISFVENICMSVVDFIEMKNMSIIFDTDTEEKIISFDLDNMERIILNLLSNAIKYNNPNGEILVNITCKDDVRISIKDNGIGIPKDKQKRIFERFGRVRDKMKAEYEGSGIGLFIVKSLVELNGGQIFVDSKLGRGSEFTIILPDRIENSEVDIANFQASTYKIDRMNIEFSDIYI